MHYLDQGRGHPVVLLHGNPTWCHLYRRFIEPLADRRRVIAPDHLGFGLSDKPTEAPHDLAWHIDNLTRFLDGLSLDRLTLVVHDWGGPIGLGFATSHPDRIARLVVMNTWAFRLPGWLPPPAMLAAIRTPDIGERLVLDENILVEQGLRAGMHRKDLITQQFLEPYRAPFRNRDSRIGMLRLVRDIPFGEQGRTAAIMAGIEDNLGGLNVPALVLWGVQDPVFPPSFASRWVQALPGADLHLLPGCSHFLQEDDPIRIIALIKTFLDKNPVGRVRSSD